MARRSVAVLAALGMAGLAACAGPAPAPPQQQAAASCRVGPDGRRPDVQPVMTARGFGGTGSVADRGIGGTGQMADRGFGGTGQVADRGLGGTGIVGTITGFASVCVNGVEVAFDATAPVLVE